LYLGEVRFLARAVLRDLVELPHDESSLAARARIGGHRLHRDAEPARSNPRLVLPLAGWRQAELFLQAAALLCRAGEAKNRLPQMRIAGERAVGGGNNRRRSEAEQVAIGFIRVKHAANAVGN